MHGFLFQYQFIVLRSLQTCLPHSYSLLVEASLTSYPILPSSWRKSRRSFELSHSYFYDLEIPGILGVPSRILQDTGSDTFDKEVPGKSGQYNS